MKKFTILLVGLLFSSLSFAQINQYQNSSPNEIKTFWEKTLGSNKKYKSFVKNDSKTVRALRSDFNEGSQMAVSKIEEGNGFYEEDFFLNDYLTNLVQLLSGGLNKNNNTLATARIQLEVHPNACAYPNGTLVFNTRLLAMMESEEELLGVVAHEMAHYMLEHAVSNYIEIAQKAKKKKAWANVAMVATTTLGAVSAAVDVANGGTGVGQVEAGAMLGFMIGDAIYNSLENLGYKFSQQQELEADAVAVALLEHIGVSKSYYISALNKLRMEDYRFGREIVKTKKKSTHPALDERIAKIGGELVTYEECPEYAKKIAEVLTVDAFVEKNIHKDYTRTINALARKENSASLSLDDYLILIPTMLDMSNTTEGNKTILSIVQKTMTEFNHPDIASLTKYEALVYVRLKDKTGAAGSLQAYIDFCDSSLEKATKEAHRNHLLKEKTWAENTLRRI